MTVGSGVAFGAAVFSVLVACGSIWQRRVAGRLAAAGARSFEAAKALHETTAAWFTKLEGTTTPMEPDVAPRAFTAADRAIAVVHTGRIYPPGHYGEVRATGVHAAEDRVADALNILRGSDVVYRTRVTYTENHEPVSVSTSWFHAVVLDQCPDLLRIGRIPGGTAAYVATNTGRHGPVSGVDRVAASTATDQEAALLQLPLGSAVLRIHNTWVAADGTAVEYGEAVQPAERWGVYRYTLPGAL